MAIFMLCLSSTPTKMETTSHNWIVLDIVHHNWHIIHSNEYILLRAYMIDRSAVEVTTVNTDHNMLMWMHMQTNIGQGAPSSEHSVVISVESKTPLCFKFLCLFNHTLYSPLYSINAVFGSFVNNP